MLFSVVFLFQLEIHCPYGEATRVVHEGVDRSCEELLDVLGSSMVCEGPLVVYCCQTCELHRYKDNQGIHLADSGH